MPSAWRVLAASSPRTRSRAPASTITPCSPNWRAVSNPIPLFAPVMSATFFACCIASTPFVQNEQQHSRVKQRHWNCVSLQQQPALPLQGSVPVYDDIDTFEQLHAIARAYVQFAQENPWLMREMFSGLSIEREAFPSLYQASKIVFMLYMEVVQRGQERGRIIDGDPGALAGVLWSLLHRVAMLIIENQMRPYTDEPEGVENMTRFSVQLLYQGLGRK